MEEKDPAGSVPAYVNRLKAERACDIYARVVKRLTDERRYRDPSCTATRLAAELRTNPRSISAAIAVCTGSNYSTLVNNLRLHDACKMLRSVACRNLTAEEIGLFAGFASRQAFYAAFRRKFNCTPGDYRDGADGK